MMNVKVVAHEVVIFILLPHPRKGYAARKFKDSTSTNLTFLKLTFEEAAISKDKSSKAMLDVIYEGAEI